MDLLNSGVGIVRNSLNYPLTSRYGDWDSPESARGPGAPGVDFLDNSYVNGFTPLARQGASDIRNLAQGVSGDNFVYGNEKRIPREVSDSITMTYAAGPANSIQDEFKARPQTMVTRFTTRGLNYLDSIPGFTNEKYWG